MTKVRVARYLAFLIILIGVSPFPSPLNATLTLSWKVYRCGLEQHERDV